MLIINKFTPESFFPKSYILKATEGERRVAAMVIKIFDHTKRSYLLNFQFSILVEKILDIN